MNPMPVEWAGQTGKGVSFTWPYSCRRRPFCFALLRKDLPVRFMGIKQEEEKSEGLCTEQFFYLCGTCIKGSVAQTF